MLKTRIDRRVNDFSPNRRLWRRFSADAVARCWHEVRNRAGLALLCGCVTPGTRMDPRDFAVTTCDLTQQQFALAQTRARESTSTVIRMLLLRCALSQSSLTLFSRARLSDLWVKLGRSQTSSSAYLQRRGQTFRLWCVAVLDRSTLVPVTNQGYLLANTPARGEVVHLGGRIVLYAGRGI